MSVINSTVPSTTTSATAGSVQAARPMVAKPPVTRSSDVELAAQQQQAEVSKEEVKQLVEQANRQLADFGGGEHVSFGYEERLNLLYVQIKDNATGEVVREIPSREVIEAKAALSDMIGMIIDRNA